MRERVMQMLRENDYLGRNEKVDSIKKMPSSTMWEVKIGDWMVQVDPTDGYIESFRIAPNQPGWEEDGE